ncbi:hypothetical protein C7830_05490 [Pandoraea apista]|nr:hypothetical protein C7830_05490 [Pandoraea apista]
MAQVCAGPDRVPSRTRAPARQADFLNRHGKSKHHPALPLFTTDDARRAIERLTPRAFDTPLEVCPEVQVTFWHAGHILGAAMAQVDANGRRILFPGDLGRTDDPIMPAPANPETPDFLVLESTYGDRLHDRTDPGAQLAEILHRTFARGGSVIVPAFAVGLTGLPGLNRSERCPMCPSISTVQWRST